MKDNNDNNATYSKVNIARNVPLERGDVSMLTKTSISCAIFASHVQSLDQSCL